MDFLKSRVYCTKKPMQQWGSKGGLLSLSLDSVDQGRIIHFFRAFWNNYDFSGRVTSSDDQYDEFYDKLWPESDIQVSSLKAARQKTMQETNVAKLFYLFLESFQQYQMMTQSLGSVCEYCAETLHFFTVCQTLLDLGLKKASSSFLCSFV